jgi:hypothetical protein
MNFINTIVDIFWFRLFNEGLDASLSLVISAIAILFTSMIFVYEKHVGLFRPIVLPRFLIGAHPLIDKTEVSVKLGKYDSIWIGLFCAIQIFFSIQIINLKVSSRIFSITISIILAFLGKLMIAGWIWVYNNTI